jgi:twitching motility protein PilT
VTLLESLLDAIIRLEGDALVMHVGEKPYVVTTSAAMSQYRGPLAWGQVELSSRILTSEAVLAMLGQIVPSELRQTLDDLGAIEHDVEPPAGSSERFTLIAARGGDDVFLELRRRIEVPEPAAAEPIEEGAQPAPAAAELPVEEAAPVEIAAAPAADAAIAEGAMAEEDVPLEIVPEIEQESLTDADVNALLAASAAPLLGPTASRPEEELIAQGAMDLPLVLEEAEVAPGVEIDARFDEVIEPESPLLGAEFADALASEIQPEEPAFVRIEPQPTVEMAETFLAVDAVSDVEAPAVSTGEGATPNDAEGEVEAPALSDVEGGVEAPAETLVVDTASEAVVEHHEPIVPEPKTAPVAAAPPIPIAELVPSNAVAAPAQEREARAIVVPLARPPQRPDAAAASSGGADFGIEDLLRLAAGRGASTVYVVAQSQPMVRSDGEIAALEIGSGAPLTESDVSRLVLEFAPAAARDAWHRGAATEWTCDVADVGPVRCLTFRDNRGPGALFRMVPPRAILADQLALTPEVRALCTQSDGLVIVTGPRASGKSTLLSAFIDLINRTSSDHVITIESQIAFAHESRRSFVSQREVRGDADAVVSAVRAALREDPDVLLIEDLRSAEVAAAAFEAAESGRLVFGSLPGASTGAALARLIEMFPPERRAEAQAALAGALRGVVAQVLLRGSKGGRIAAREILVNTPAVAALIEEGKIGQLPAAMESGRRHGMMPLNDALASFVRDGSVNMTEAYLKAFDKDGLLAALERHGGDTSMVERLA